MDDSRYTKKMLETELEMLQLIATYQEEVVELGLRRLNGNLQIVFAALHGTGAVGSLNCSVSGDDLLLAVQEHIASHQKKRDGK